MKVIFAFESGSNCNYIVRLLEVQTKIFKDFSYSFVRSPQYGRFNQDGYDILIYQTFPNETHPFKFNARLVKERDEKFMEFKGIKILMDSFDDGDRDGFSRMGDASKTLPRIKGVPSYRFLKNYNVIFSVPPYFGLDTIADMEDGKRDVLLHYAPTMIVENQPHEIRMKILEILRREFSKECNFKRIPRNDYFNFLKHTLMSITGPGFGPCSNTFWTAMQYGTLSIAEESVDRYKMLPGVDLIPGEDYISFRLDTLSDKLRHLMNNPDECDRIRKSGHQKLKEGYNIENRARDLYKVLESL